MITALCFYQLSNFEGFLLVGLLYSPSLNILTLIKLSVRSLWSYLKRVAEKLHNFRRLLEVVPADNRGPYRRALVSSVRRRTYSLGHKSVTITSSMKGLPYFTKEDGSVLPGALEYFTEGIVPLLQNFFTILFDPTGMGALPNEGEIAVQVASALIVSPLQEYV